MEINKQLFEDILSGKLKGTFVLWCKQKISSTKLIRNNSYYSETHPYGLCGTTYTPNGLSSPYGFKNVDDIVDFIPDTDMKENELTIKIPDDKVVDWEESKKQNKIVLKDKRLTYEDVCKKLFKDSCYYITSRGNIELSYVGVITDPNNAATDHQLKCILAKNQLANVATFLNDGWKPSKTNSGRFDAWVLFTTPNKDYIGCVGLIDCAHNCNVLFKSRELALQAIKILGEETVKLALEPLGI